MFFSEMERRHESNKAQRTASEKNGEGFFVFRLLCRPQTKRMPGTGDTT